MNVCLLFLIWLTPRPFYDIMLYFFIIKFISYKVYKLGLWNSHKIKKSCNTMFFELVKVTMVVQGHFRVTHC